MMDEPKKKDWGLIHWVATISTSVAAILGALHLSSRSDSVEASFTLEEKIELLVEVRSMRQDITNIMIHLKSADVVIKGITQELKDRPSLACFDSKIRNYGGYN
jgi:hypothetical protein